MRRIPTIGLCTVVLLLIGARFNSNGVLFAQSPVATANDVDADNPYIRKLVGRLGAADPQERVAAAQEIANLGKWAKPVVPHLIDLLADEAPAKEGNVSSQVRSHVIGMLADLGQPLAGDAMLEGLKHPNRLCRMGVIDVLGNFREERAVPKLVELLGDDDREVGSRAINALAMIGEPAIEPLLETLSSSNASARAFALGALGRLRHAKVVQPVARLLGDDDVAVRTFAIQALEELGYKARSNQENDALLRQLVIDELKSALHTQRIAVRLAAVECATGFYCVDLQAALAECLSDDDATLREQAVKAISVIRQLKDFSPLLVALKDANAEVRAAAAHGLSIHLELPIDDVAEIEQLIDSLGDVDPRVRSAVAQTLGHIRSGRKRVAVPAVIKLLHDGDANVVEAAIQSLVDLGDKQAANSLFALLADPKFQTKAAVALASFDDGRALEPLRLLLDQKNEDVILALGRFKDCESVESLIKLLDDGDGAVRGAAARALGFIRDGRAVEPLINHLKNNGEVNDAVASALGEIKDPRAIQPLIEAAIPNQFVLRRWEFGPRGPAQNPVAAPLRNIGFPAIEPLAKALKNESQEIRGVAAHVLYELSFAGGCDREDSQPAIEPLAAALVDESNDVRNYAASALGALGDDRAADGLLDVIVASESTDSLGWNAANWLSNLHDPKSFAQLIVLLEDERPAVRMNAVRALGEMKDEHAVEPLLALLNDGDPSVRAAAARGLSLLKAPAALKPLIMLLGDKDAGVRIAAADGLGRLGDVTAVEPLAKLRDKSDFKLQVAAAIALVRLDDPRGPEQIAACLKDSDVQNREHAATEVCVSFLKSAALVPPLVAALDDSSIRVRLYAAGALGRIKTEAAAAALLAKVDDRENLRAILQALAQSNDDRAPAVLLHHLNESEPWVRTEAAAGLGEFGSRTALEPLIKHLADPASEVRLAVIDALLKLRATEALSALKSALEDSDPEIRAHAARAIKRLTAMPQPCVDGKQ